jgi:ubiquinone/menaquinone biosynthesis C-methylase UbiE
MTTLPNLFDQWAEVYDTDLNPLLALERRTLPSLLPAIAQAHILDVGCGTGRWLQHLELLQPASLTGADTSDAMLAIARRKVSASTTLVNAPATRLPASNSSHDLVLASFVLSYIEDLPAFAAECARILKSAAHLIVTDMHPATASARDWTRGFRHGQQHIQIPAQTHPLTDILAAFAQQGLTLVAQHEPAFAEPERSLFVEANKHSAYEDLQHTPAIYLLKFQKQTSFELINARSSTGPTTWSTAPIHLGKGRIATTPDLEAHSLDLFAYTVLPGLINAHDHLEFALFPNLGRPPAEPPFDNSPEWAKEIHQTHADTIAKHCQVPLATRLWFGILRNLLAGVTTVCHHNPLHPELTRPGLPVHVVREIGWAHSLNFDPDLISHFTSTPASQPFIIHAAEGIDESSRNEFHLLDALDLLTPRTVIVHGLALQEEDITLLNQRGSALVVCPTSNRFLFAQSPSNDVIQSARRVALASDSPITAAGDLLDEIAHLHHQGLDPIALYNLVTTNAANVLHLCEGQGTLATDTPADLIAIRSSHSTPAEVLAHLTLAEIELVIAKGQIQLASPAIYQSLPTSLRAHLHQMQIDTLERWVNAPIPSLFVSAEQVLGSDNLCLGNKEVRHSHPL